MLKLLKKKSVIAAVFITGAAVLILVLFGNDNFLTKTAKTVFSPVLTVTSKISHSVGNFKDYLIELKIYREENEKLNEQISKMRNSNRDVAELTAENERLKELLAIKSSLKYKTKAGLVISNEPDNRQNTLVVNKGTNDGIKEGAAVLASNGIVGKVVSSGIGWSRVMTLLSNESAVGVRVVRTGALAVVEGDVELSKNNFCKMGFFADGSDVSVGDIVETTGAAGLYPEGKTVGTIVKIQTDADGKEYAVVKPSVDFNNIYEVLVVTEIVEG